MSITPDKIKTALSNVIDPDLGKDIVSLNMVKDIQIDGKDVRFSVELTTPACPVKDEIERACINAVKHMVDKQAQVKVNMTSNVSEGKKNAPNAKEGEEPMLSGVKNIIAVASGKGGVGKSTVAANIAVGLARSGASVGLLDMDIYGPSIPTMFGIHERPNITTQKKLVPHEKFNVKLISMGFLVDTDQAMVWRGPMATSAVKQFLNEVEWGELDYMVLDLPPGTGDIQLTIVQTVPLTGSVIVSTPQNVALDDARKGINMFEKVNVPVLGIVENMSYFIPPELPDNKYYIFGKEGAKKLATKTDTYFLGEVPIEQSIRESSDDGTPIVVADETSKSAQAFLEISNRLAQQISIRNAKQPATEKVNISIKP